MKTRSTKRGTIRDLNRWKTLSIVGLVAAIPACIALVALLIWQHPALKLKTAAVRTGLVQIGADGFLPATLTVKAGTAVTWTNGDKQNIAHWVEADPYPHPSDPADLTSGDLKNQMQYIYTFAKPGTYHYHDRVNPTRSGTIIVQ